MTQPVPARIGDTIDEIDTPALILELDAFEANVAAQVPQTMVTLEGAGAGTMTEG